MMHDGKQTWLLSWIAFLVLILSMTAGILLPHIPGVGQGLQYTLGLVFWALVMAGAVFLFILATRQALRMQHDEALEKEKEQKQERETTRKKSARKTSEELNVDMVARKILRRVDLNDPPEKAGKMLLDHLAGELEIMSGIYYHRNKEGTFEPAATYALHVAHTPYSFREGEGLTGQVARNREVSLLHNIPESYGEVLSGLGKTRPAYLALIPVVKEDQTRAVIECAGFRYAGEPLDQLFRIMARGLATSGEPPAKEGTNHG